MSASIVRVAIVGAGAIGRFHGLLCAGESTLRVVAVADVRLGAARSLANELGASAYRSYRAMLLREAPDALIICTPPDSHLAIASDALCRGIAVLCEKPLALDAAAARELATLAREHDALLAMSAKFRYVDDVVSARRVVREGAIGDLLAVETAFTARQMMHERWNASPLVSGGGVIIDNGTHAFDLIRFVTGPIAEVHAIAGPRYQRLAVEDTARVFVRTAAGVAGCVDLSWSIDKALDAFLTLYGTRGAIAIGWGESRAFDNATRKWSSFGPGYDKSAAFGAQLKEFAAALAGRGRMRMNEDDALAAALAVDAAYRSLREDAPVALACGVPDVANAEAQIA